MRARFGIYFAVLLIVLSGCTPKAPSAVNELTDIDPETTSDGGQAADDADEDAGDDGDGDEDSATAGGTAFVEYENKAIGYRILRPDNWYWRHYIGSEIGDGTTPVLDYFFTNRLGEIGSVGTEKPASITIEVSSRPITDFSESLSGLTKTAAAIGGIAAERYEGILDNEIFQNQKTIQYYFTRGDNTFRLLYINDQGFDDEEAVFKKIAESFTFSE